MLKIAHRINTIEELNNIDKNLGVEIDVRYHNNRLILHHNPFGHHESTPCDFESFLKEYKHKLLILNVKTEGIENKCIELMEKYNIKDWFFLDLSMPYFVKYAKYSDLPKNHLCVRFSEHEPIEYALEYKDCAEWIWIDCFKSLPINDENYNIIKKHFKICLVSPELQGFELKEIENFKNILKEKEIDAVCTDYPELW